MVGILLYYYKNVKFENLINKETFTILYPLSSSNLKKTISGLYSFYFKSIATIAYYSANTVIKDN